MGPIRTGFVNLALQSHPRSWAPQAPTLGVLSCSHHLEFLIIFEQETLHFHFVLGSANYVADPGLTCIYTWPTVTNTILSHLPLLQVTTAMGLPWLRGKVTRTPEYLHNLCPSPYNHRKYHFAAPAPKLLRKSSIL